jgi:predicted Zn-dependent peptidase
MQTEDIRSLTEFFNELNGILKTVPADELARAKATCHAVPVDLETTGDIGVWKTRTSTSCRTTTFPYVQNIEAITAADVQRIAQKYIRLDRLR